jgi:tetrahydrodipicolinate N-succinyltransferase
MLLKRDYAEKVRVVPGAIARYGAYISSGVIMSYINMVLMLMKELWWILGQREVVLKLVKHYI